MYAKIVTYFSIFKLWFTLKASCSAAAPLFPILFDSSLWERVPPELVQGKYNTVQIINHLSEKYSPFTHLSLHYITLHHTITPQVVIPQVERKKNKGKYRKLHPKWKEIIPHYYYTTITLHHYTTSGKKKKVK